MRHTFAPSANPLVASLDSRKAMKTMKTMLSSSSSASADRIDLDLNKFPPPPSTPSHPLPSPLQSELEYNPSLSYSVTASPSTASYAYSQPSPSSDYFMPTGQPNNPPIRVQQSIPRSGGVSTPQPFSVVEENRRHQSWQPFGSSHSLQAQPAQPAQPTQPAHPRLGLAQQRSSHNRHSSASSIGSVDPDSPYIPTTSYPRIIDPDSHCYPSPRYDTFDHHLSPFLQKPLPASTATFSESFLSPTFRDYCATTNDENYQMAMREAMSQALHAPRDSGAGSAPTGPMASYDEEYDDGFKVPMESRGNMPKLDRTMSDIYQDELYNPVITTSAPVQQSAMTVLQPHLLSPRRDVFSERLQAANNDHMSARSSSPAATISRERSPFRQGREWAAEGFSHSNSPGSRLVSGAQMGEQSKAEADAIAVAKHKPAVEFEVLKTISPKEAFLEFDDTTEAPRMPLLPPENPTTRANDRNIAFPIVKQESSQSDGGDNDATQQSFSNMATPRRESSSNYSTTSATGSSTRPNLGNTASRAVPQIPQQYPFISRRQNSSTKSTTDSIPDFPATFTSMESTASENGAKSSQEHSESSTEIPRPSNTTANSGTYTCTYHGCTMRFETPSKLQKHKRDDHRQSSPQTIPSGSAGSAAALAANRNSQAGPHKCERINPSTGKPCNSVFSRPYDLTRHEDTIHNARKQKVRCQLCTEEKTFSRNDALTRHLRVVHPEVEWPGKVTKRKGG